MHVDQYVSLKSLGFSIQECVFGKLNKENGEIKQNGEQIAWKKNYHRSMLKYFGEETLDEPPRATKSYAKGEKRLEGTL